MAAGTDPLLSGTFDLSALNTHTIILR